MVAAQHPLPVRQQGLEQSQRLLRVARLAGPGREVAADGEGVGVVAAPHPFLVRQQGLEQPQCLLRVARLAGPGRDVVAGGEAVGVVATQLVKDSGMPLPPAVEVLPREARRTILQAR